MERIYIRNCILEGINTVLEERVKSVTRVQLILIFICQIVIRWGILRIGILVIAWSWYNGDGDIAICFIASSILVLVYILLFIYEEIVTYKAYKKIKKT